MGSLPLGKSAPRVTLVVREGAAVAPRGSLRLRPGDRVALLAEPEDTPRLGRLFRAPAGWSQASSDNVQQRVTVS